MADKPTPLPIKLLEDGQPFIQVPRFWATDLMGGRLHYPKTGHSAEAIPASFWLYMTVLWGWICNGNKEREAHVGMRDFPMRRPNAVKWTAAVSVSGLFDVKAGQHTTGEKTYFRYRCEADKADWKAFVDALNLALVQLKGTEGEFGQNVRSSGNSGAFKVYLAELVDKQRAARRLPPVNSQFLNDAADGRIKDMEGRPIAARNKKGEVVPISYDGKGANRLHHTGHKRNCDCADCVELRYAMRDEIFNREVERAPF
jgi:hypothetical protein